MICLTCWQKITNANRQKYKGGLRLPYCANCIGQYIAKNKLQKMNVDQRVEFIRETKKKIEEVKYTKEQLEDSQKQMKQIGLTETEIQTIFKGK